MKTILISIVMAMSAHFAFAAEEAKTAAPAPAEKAAEVAAPAEAKVEHTMKEAKGKMHAAMGAKHEEMMKMCKEMHPDMDCTQMMKSCGGNKDMKQCMDKMATKK